MSTLNRPTLFASTFALTALLLAGVVMSAAETLPANYVHVDAPAAQRLIVKVKSAHPEIVKLGLHATPPSATDNLIIANANPSKIGKKSSAPDMEKLALNKAIAVRIDKDSIYDLLLPITDATGGDLGSGFVVMEVPFSKASSEADAIKIGVLIRDEIQRNISSKAALYQR